MRVLLISPLNRSYVVMPSLGLGYLAGVLKRDGHQVQILHCIKEKLTFDSFQKIIAAERFDVYGVQMFSYDWASVQRHLRIIKSIHPSATTILGGAHPSGDPLETLMQMPDADFAFQGEAEIGFCRFLQSLPDDRARDDWSGIPGLVWRTPEGRVNANPNEVVLDLDSLPFPAWDLQRPDEFPPAPHGAFAKNFPTAPIIITRGCPFSCTFCAGRSISGSKLRRRSIDHVLEEIRFLKAHHNVREIHLEDECFTIHKSLVMEFCEKLLSADMGISWGLPSGVRLDTLDKEMLDQMVRAGCHCVAIGIEFGSQRILDLSKKKLSLDTVREKMVLFRGAGIKTTGFFLLGLPGETKKEVQATIDLSLQLGLDRAQYNNYMPLPGSELWKSLKATGALDHVNLNKLFVHDVALAPEGMSASDLKWCQRKAYLRFYLRPSVLWRLLKEIASWRHLRLLLRRFLDALS